MAGGVFIVVECKDKKSWQVLKAKGHPCSRNDRYAALYHPATCSAWKRAPASSRRPS